MSFEKYKEFIEDGDTVILYLGFGNLLQTTIENGKTHQTKFGAFKHSDIIGKRFGSKIQCTKGYIHALYPTPELWTVTLPHRTQILYTTDISMITFQLDLQPGSVVVESGTGSASLSHAILRTIAPDGHLHTFDFHEARVAKAQKEFDTHGFGALVTVKQRDVCKDGFDLTNEVDAVFLDLPLPWEAVPHAKNALKDKGGRFCSFSPCIEQVQRTCEALRNTGFSDIRTVECLVRTFDPKPINLPLADLGTHPEGTLLTDDYNCSSQESHCDSDEIQDKTTKRPLDVSDDDAESSKVVTTKNRKRGEEPKDSEDKKKPCYQFTSALTPKEMPGHTGHLTFATLYP